MLTRLVPSPASRRARLGVTLAALLAGALAVPTTASARTVRYDVQPTPDATRFTLASFNVLGSNHTVNSTRFGTGVHRMANVVRLLENNSVDVVGFQELQADQLTSFLTRTGGKYAVYPGFSLRLVDTENSIAWDTSQWQAVEETTTLIPYFDGRERPMPVVKLRNIATGMTAWFANFHNPATNRRHPHQDGWRAQAIAREVVLARQLGSTGLPVFITGDMNERAKVFCAMTGQAPMRAARGGSYRNGVCDPARPWYVDWIFGLRRQMFTDYTEVNGTLVKRTSDHPMVVAGVAIEPATFPSATTPPPVSDPSVPDPSVPGPVDEPSADRAALGG